MNCFSSAIEYGEEIRDTSVIDSQVRTIESGLNFPLDLDNTTIKFPLGSSPLYIDMLQLEIEMKCRLVLADGSLIPPGSALNVAPIAGLSSYFDSLELWSRGVLVKKYEGYNYTEYIKALCTYGKDWFKSIGSASSMWPNVSVQQVNNFIIIIFVTCLYNYFCDMSI